jgi:hypothetical protein
MSVLKKDAVFSLPREFRSHLFEHSTSFFSLVGMPGELLEMEAMLLNLNFQTMEGLLSF